MCLKKYCECFQGAVQCTAMCTCLHCKNTGESAAAALLRAAEARVATHSSAAAVAAFTGVGGYVNTKLLAYYIAICARSQTSSNAGVYFFLIDRRPLRKPIVTGSTADGLEDHNLIQAAIDLVRTYSFTLSFL